MFVLLFIPSFCAREGFYFIYYLLFLLLEKYLLQMPFQPVTQGSIQ